MDKKCPISNHPIDLVHHNPTAVQVACPASHWFTTMFASVGDAYEYAMSLDVPKQIEAARREARDGLVRLVGDRWLTEYMTPEALDRLIVEAGVPSTTPKRRRSTSNAKTE